LNIKNPVTLHLLHVLHVHCLTTPWRSWRGQSSPIGAQARQQRPGPNLNYSAYQSLANQHGRVHEAFTVLGTNLLISLVTIY